MDISLQIGLAVGDIEAVQKDARLKRLAMQVQITFIVIINFMLIVSYIILGIHGHFLWGKTILGTF